MFAFTLFFGDGGFGVVTRGLFLFDPMSVMSAMDVHPS